MNGKVIEALLRITRAEAEAALASAVMDPIVGILHAPLPLPEVKSEGQQYQFHIAKVLPGKWVAPHSHPGDPGTDGDEEPYRFFGKGEMNLGVVEEKYIGEGEEDLTPAEPRRANESEEEYQEYLRLRKQVYDESHQKFVQWIKIPVYDGALVIVRKGEVHSFRNTGDKPVLFLFACPADHLTTNRKGTEGMQEAVPLWYPKS